MIWAILLSGILPVLPGAQSGGRAALVRQYCIGCHSSQTKSGGVVLEGVDPSDPAAQPAIWEKVIRKVSSGEMPPPGAPRPDAAAVRAFTTELTAGLDAAARRSPFAGRPVIRRLNRHEYTNAVRDLLHIELPLAAALPQDESAGDSTTSATRCRCRHCYWSVI